MTDKEKKQAVKDFCKFLSELKDKHIDKIKLVISNDWSVDKEDMLTAKLEIKYKNPTMFNELLHLPNVDINYECK